MSLWIFCEYMSIVLTSYASGSFPFILDLAGQQYTPNIVGCGFISTLRPHKYERIRQYFDFGVNYPFKVKTVFWGFFFMNFNLIFYWPKTCIPMLLWCRFHRCAADWPWYHHSSLKSIPVLGEFQRKYQWICLWTSCPKASQGEF